MIKRHSFSFFLFNDVDPWPGLCCSPIRLEGQKDPIARDPSITRLIFRHSFNHTMKFSLATAILVSTVGSSHAFAPQGIYGTGSSFSSVTALFNGPEIGAGGMADTRNPDAIEHEDPRKSISVAPSFEEYMKQRAAGGSQAAESIATPTGTTTQPPTNWGQPAAAVVSPPAVTQPSVPVAAPVASGGDAIASMTASQTAMVDTIAAAIPDLEVKPDLSWAAGEPIAGATCTLDGREAPGPANIAWLSSVSIPGKLSSLTIFNGPLTDVPHLLSRCYVDADKNQLELALDFRPRAYGAYEMVDGDGNYPGPEDIGRKAFEYSGARMDFFNKFGTPELSAKLNEFSKSLQDATPSNIQPTELDQLTGGPLAISLTMPASDHNVQVVDQMRQLAAQEWLSWATDSSGAHEHRPGAPINTQYVYDSKFRINAYGALKDYYTFKFGGADGAKLAAAESGPLDEAYVGGGS